MSLYKKLGYFFCHVAIALLFYFLFSQVKDLETAISFIVVALILYIALVKHFDYLDPLVVYLIPWLIILFFSTTRLSRYAVPFHSATYSVLLFAITAALFAGGGKPIRKSTKRYCVRTSSLKLKPATIFLLIDLLFFSFTALNIMIAGYVPLLRGLSGGDTGYLDFGVHGLFGFYLALANALAIVSFIIFLRTGKLIYLIRYAAIIAIFVALITRQNLISVAVESVAAYSLVRNRIKLRTIVVGAICVGIIFAAIGSFRSGSIREIAGIEKEYSWIPEPVIWLYSYSYFNVANLDNMVFKSSAPYYNASSLSYLIPSFLRPKYESTSYLLISNFNVSSYMYPVYEDTGRLGVVSLTFVALWVTARRYALLGPGASVGDVGTYCVLYFCAFFSFFVNFWFFLPIIFQIVFFKMLNNVSERASISEIPRKVASSTANKTLPMTGQPG